MGKYLDTPRQWDAVIKHILDKREPIGWDTEFDGVDFDAGDNCMHKSKLDVWSLAVFDGGYHPRGYRTSRACVLPACALSYFATILSDENIKKYAHNSTVDVHTAWNAGVDVLGVLDTLSMVRWMFPGRLLNGLDVLGREFLDDSKFMSFRDLCGRPIFVEKDVEYKYCSCGEDGCRKRKGHVKSIQIVKELVETKKYEYVPISSIGPDDPKWLPKLDYAGQDSVLALGLGDYLSNKMRAFHYENPFMAR